MLVVCHLQKYGYCFQRIIYPVVQHSPFFLKQKSILPFFPIFISNFYLKLPHPYMTETCFGGCYSLPLKLLILSILTFSWRVVYFFSVFKAFALRVLGKFCPSFIRNDHLAGRF